MASGCSLAAKPTVVVEQQIIREQVPAALLQDFTVPKRKLERTSDIIAKLNDTEAARQKYAAQVAGLKEWNQE